MKTNLIVGEGTALDHWNDAQCLVNMPHTTLEQLAPDGARVVIIAPHPDDEILGSAGLLQQLNAAGHTLLLISITDGTASHPGSTDWPPKELGERRVGESVEALRRLGLSLPAVKWVRAGFEDSQVADRETEVSTFIEEHLQPGDVVFATWRKDGHSDHDAVGRASSRAAYALGVPLYEVPIWTWHWAHDNDTRVPWDRARKLCLSAHAVARKRYAAHAFTSQLQTDPSTGLGPILAPLVLERLLQPFEVVFMPEKR